MNQWAAWMFLVKNGNAISAGGVIHVFLAFIGPQQY